MKLSDLAPLIYAVLFIFAATLVGLVAVKAETIGHEQLAIDAPKQAKKAARKAYRAPPKRRTGGSYSTSANCLPASLKAKLSTIEKRWGKVRIVSTFRKGAVIAGSGKPSMHAACKAVDFHPAKGTYRQVVNWLRHNHGGGFGTYSCSMHHLHIDSGPKVRWHHCVDRRGRKRR